WTDESGNGMTHAPVHGVVQQHIRSNQALNSGSVYLGTHGRGFYRTDDLFTAVEENDEFADIDGNSFVTNLSVYPNPLNNVGVLAFDLKKNSETTIKIYNLTGSLVKSIKLGVKAKGNHQVKFDASLLCVGTYIISLESGTERSVAKFIVTR
ncbi:MAG: T9SS type A sorting domain-containing protein, partial [Flavobacteriales bacterium]|nr:T9SS type A sorting domain-containing protein [Flavobacteriales bacterium]